MEPPPSNLRFLSEHRRPVPPRVEPRTPQPIQRPYTAHGQALRDGLVVCQAVLVTIPGTAGSLGAEPRDDLTAWFYGALDSAFEDDLELLAEAGGRASALPPVEPVDIVLVAPGGELRLVGCLIGLPLRCAGPASTLQYRLSHRPAASAAGSGTIAAA